MKGAATAAPFFLRISNLTEGFITGKTGRLTNSLHELDPGDLSR